MKTIPLLGLAFAAAIAVSATTGSARDSGRLPGARSIKISSAAGDFWPTMTLALDGTSAWVACKEQGRVVRVDTRTGKTTKSVDLGDLTIAVATGYRSIWAVGSSGTLYRLSPSGKVVKQIPLNVAAAYNVWIGGGSVWVPDDQGARVVRVSPKTNRIVAGDALVVPTRSAETDGRGFPTMNAVQRVSVSTGGVTPLARPVGRVDVHGLVARNVSAWLADNTSGRPYRLVLAS
jgi:hypothetical protein